MAKIFTIAHVPDELSQQWLQHLRDFDTQHPGCHFEVAADLPNVKSVGELIEILRVHPELPLVQVFDLDRKGGKQ